MTDQKSQDEDTTEAAKKPSSSPQLTSPAFEQEQRRQQVQRDAKQNNAGAHDPEEAVNQDG